MKINKSIILKSRYGIISMMLVTASFLLTSHASFAQLAKIENIDNPHLKDRIGIEANLGLTRFGQYFNAGFSKNFSTKVYGKIQLGVELGKYEKKNLKYRSYTVDLGANYIFFKWRNAAFISATGGLSCNFDYLRNIEISDNKYTNYGLFIGIESEYYFNANWVALLNLRQKFLFNADYGTLVFFGGIGVKYVF